MKSTLTGLVAAIIVGAIGLIVLRSMGVLNLSGLTPTSSESPTPSASPNYQVVDASPSATPKPSLAPETGVKTTKGGLVLGESTTTSTPKPTTTTTTKTVTHKTYTLAKVSKCPSTVTSELKDISSSLSIQYVIKEGYSAAITVWGDNGVELSGQNLYTGSGKIVDTGDNKYVKVLIQPNECPAAEDNWMTVTASN